MIRPRMAPAVGGLAFILILAAAAGSSADSLDPKTRKGVSQTEFTTTRSGSWLILKSANFRICTQGAELKLDELPAMCESLRSILQDTWLGRNDAPIWSPRCDVIVHPTLAGYTRALGTSAGNSVGCATMKLDGGRVVGRRIDIRLDADNWMSDALPHELTHVVIADRFCHRRIPPWADEGIGVLSESRTKQTVRARALQAARTRGHVFTLKELVTLNRFPSPNYRDAFYGQSASLVQVLLQRGEQPARLLDFVERAMDHGYDRAARDIYGLDGMDALCEEARNHVYRHGDLSKSISRVVLASASKTPSDAIDAIYEIP